MELTQGKQNPILEFISKDKKTFYHVYLTEEQIRDLCFAGFIHPEKSDEAEAFQRMAMVELIKSQIHFLNSMKNDDRSNNCLHRDDNDAEFPYTPNPSSASRSNSRSRSNSIETSESITDRYHFESAEANARDSPPSAQMSKKQEPITFCVCI